jgi:hypothetical protein
MAAVAFKCLAALQALTFDHAPDLWARMMEAGMIFDSENLKVLNSVVVLDAVPMMDVLSCEQRSAKMAFHDDTVLKLEIRADTNCDVSI